MAEQITDEELFNELRHKKALIVHCSRAGKGDETLDTPLYPDDLRYASKACANGGNLCCSVIWPAHIETFGSVGIVLWPRSIKSITSICLNDAGSYVDPKTGKREGLGDPVSMLSVRATFTNATGYNEWNVMDAVTIGIFVHPQTPLDVSCKTKLSEIPGYDPLLGDEEIIGTRAIPLREIFEAFPGLRVYSFTNAELVEIKWSGTEIFHVKVTSDDLYP